MSIYSKIGSGLTNLFSMKSAKKVVSEAASVSSAQGKVLKTTASTVGASSPATAGGVSYLRKTASNMAKGTSQIAAPIGKVVLGVGVASGSALVLTKAYGSAKSEWTKTQDVINYENLIKAQKKDLDNQSTALDLAQRLVDMNNINTGGNSGITSEADGTNADGSSGNPFAGFSDTYDKANPESGDGFPLGTIIIVGLVGTAGYYGYKAYKKKK